jgi:hypothetical protein
LRSTPARAYLGAVGSAGTLGGGALTLDG